MKRGVFRESVRVRRWMAAFIVGGLLAAGCTDSGDSGDSGDERGGTGSATEETAVPGVTAGCDGTVEAPEPRFIVDACGRVVILRGVNVEGSSKSDESETHLPASALDGQATLQRWGWNNVRFLVFWGAIEPTDGTFDEEYLDGVEKWLDWYADNDIHVVLDMHQDLYGWAVGGDGAPDWAVDTGGLAPGKLADGQPWYLLGADPAVQAAYQSFWNPKPGERDLKVDYLEALAHLAERFADHPAVIGYDVMNEPSFANGDLAATLAIQADAAAGKFVNTNLTEFMQDGIDAVRAHDDDAWVMVEPTSLLNAFPYPGDLEFEKLSDPREGAPRLSYAGHLYQQQVHDGLGYPVDDPYLATWEKYRTAEAERMGAGLWIGEWGGGDQERMDEYVAELTTMADRTMAGWAYWAWDGGWSPVDGGGATLSANGHRLLRVQPRTVAGVPESFVWDSASSTFDMTWTGRDGVVGSTELAVPAIGYEKGIEVVVDGDVLSDDDVDAAWDRETSVFEIEVEDPLAKHTVCVQPAGSAHCVV